jgi:predicted small secreted protein
MKRALSLLLILLVAMVLSACDTTDTAQDASAAQQVQPNLAGFERSNADSITDAISRIGAGATLTTGNAPGAAAIARMEQVLQCFQDVGAVDASIYVQQEVTNMIPDAGLSIVLNQTRMNRNMIACLTNPDGGFSAQSLQIQPCAQSGNFTYQEEDFAYAYIGVGDTICTGFNAHFAQYNPEINR